MTPFKLEKMFPATAAAALKIIVTELFLSPSSSSITTIVVKDFCHKAILHSHSHSHSRTNSSIYYNSLATLNSHFHTNNTDINKMTECQCHHHGSIHLITGPMFSGKTYGGKKIVLLQFLLFRTELFRLVCRHKLAGKRVVIIKSAKDKRYDEVQACTHDMRKMDAISAFDIASVLKQCHQCDVIGIDEGQFYPDVVTCSQELANAGKTVIIAALNGDYRQTPFPNVVPLFGLAEKIEKLSAVCQGCGNSASFTARLLQDTKLELIGGKEAYRALCRICLLQQQQNDGHHTKECPPQKMPKIATPVKSTNCYMLPNKDGSPISYTNIPSPPVRSPMKVIGMSPSADTIQRG